MTGSLEIKNVQQGDEGSYKCRVTNADKYRHSSEGRLSIKRAGQSRSPPFSLNAIPCADADADNAEPRFETRPQGQVLRQKETAVFECSVNGHPQPRIEWLKDRQPLAVGREGRTRLIGQGTLLIDNVSASDIGTYTCRAANDEDSIDASAPLDVLGEILLFIPHKYTRSSQLRRLSLLRRNRC